MASLYPVLSPIRLVTYNLRSIPVRLLLVARSIRFVDKFKAVNTIPPSYRVFLLNGETFDIYFESFSLMIKIKEKEYYIGDLDERNYAIKHINRLLQEPIATPGSEGEEDSESPSTPPPTTPPAEEPAEEEPAA